MLPGQVKQGNCIGGIILIDIVPPYLNFQVN